MQQVGEECDSSNPPLVCDDDIGAFIAQITCESGERPVDPGGSEPHGPNPFGNLDLVPSRPSHDQVRSPPFLH
jgi:hypothetical protein